MANYLDGCGKELCTHCNKHRTKEGHDACIGTLDNVMNACCGHGETDMAYVQFGHKEYHKEPNKIRLSGQSALDYINNKRKTNMEILKAKTNHHNIEELACNI